MDNSPSKRSISAVFTVAVMMVGLTSAAWACTLGAGPTDGIYPVELSPPSVTLGASGTAAVDAIAVFDGFPPLNGAMTMYQDNGLSGAMGNGKTARASLPDACTTSDPNVGTLNWVDNVGTGTLVLEAGWNGTNYVPGVYGVCGFHTTNKANRFLAYFTFV